MFYQFIPGGNIKNWCYYLLTMCAIPFIFSYTKNINADQLIGDLSYPIYLCHVFVLYSILPVLKKLKLTDYQGVVTSICTILFSIVLIKLIINPIERYRQARVHAA